MSCWFVPLRAGSARMVLAVLALVAASAPGGASAAQATATARLVARPAAPTYVPPVADGVIVDHFRPPATAYSAGNRGIDEVTTPGAVIVASAEGDVVFAGPVAGALHITLRHADGLRTSYSFLAGVLVQIGDHVTQGTPIGLSSGAFHFGVRDPDGVYLDPEALMRGAPSAHLVPGPDEGAAPLSDPGGVGALDAVVSFAGSEIGARLLAQGHEILAAQPATSLVRLTLELEQLRRSQRGCTPAGEVVPAPPGRRLAVLVGGLGSTTDTAAVDRVDTAALGYEPADVVRFSYRGGRVPRSGSAAVGPLEQIPAHAYSPVDTSGDLHQAADRLVALLVAVAQAQPGVPIDVIAHSLGGVVTRLALARAAASGALPAGLGVVVTIGAPNQGDDLATAVAAIGPTTPSSALLGYLQEGTDRGLDPRARAVAQLSEASPVIAELSRPVPDGVHLLAIGASGDLVVPAVRTRAAGADHAIVHLGGLEAHGRLPAAPATTREIGLALAGRHPTCVPLVRGVGDVVTSHLVAQAEDTIGLALAGPM